ncbi:hypothetical protein ZIOFF_035014 [Zingiber officinale]|uniref:Epidermal patterning factor-like protein n=1 Tax=Zingiber officinale TaxID=94328 RepID=A0A8J5GLY0_ZINOF|nr:hypothetical protein ZIOFF_035014 [Zingiber officinale]
MKKVTHGRNGARRSFRRKEKRRTGEKQEKTRESTDRKKSFKLKGQLRRLQAFRLLEIASGVRDQKVRALIGSRPPMCERRCRGCGHCEAIQVPVIPQALNKAMASDLRGDIGSNYKPLSWKCKCGDLIFNP